ncbi:AraC family transcriptional regulator [Paenibacillus sp. S150]|uniref:helix-turn-helix transcriptional regulator n=1 Tax=Paenibacillus sp. S150 TaxID=2749826 RepID=UPI001C59ADA3|nr:AraC family transcriptional regulator [Paenibacillus sp. S150]MBW4079953.1 AraC family transcriptional regulator [Paenibacillus sp. S150]
MRRNIFIPPPTFKHHLLYPVGIGHYYNFPTHRENRESGFLPEYNLHLVLRGRGYVIHEGERLDLTGGCGFFYPPKEQQQYGSDEDDPWEICFVHFTAVAPLLSMWKLDTPSFFRFAGIQYVQRIFSDMFELMDAFKTGIEPHLSSLVYELILFLLKNSESLKNTNTLDHKEIIHGIADKIHDKPDFHWTTEHMAELSGYSLYHFIRLFQKIIGLKPNEYVKVSRLSAAKNLLISTELPIFEIAENIGFSNTSYFIKVFREWTGFSPQVYRSIYKQV